MYRQLSLMAGLIGLTASCDVSLAQRTVRPGIDVLLSDSIHLVRNIRVGLLTNQTGVDRNGIDDVTRLVESGVALTTLFSPEHGFRGALDEEHVGHSIDAATGIPIYSLYGDVRSPGRSMLENVDLLMIDLQDIGSRTYTYVSTAVLAVEAAAAAGIPVLVADRPNPIGGWLVQGPMLMPDHSSFVGMLPIPIRHGMTLGELVLFANNVREIGAEITVIPADGWDRTMWFDETGLPWIRPSPNMPSLESATHYPGTVLFEATNLSVGRGTPIAFQVLGAPWLEPTRVIDLLDTHPGVTISDTVVTPQSPADGKHEGVAIPSVRLVVRDRTAYDPVRLAADLFRAVRTVHADSLVIREAVMDRLAGTDQMRLGGWTREGIASWDDDISNFVSRRARFLLY